MLSTYGFEKEVGCLLLQRQPKRPGKPKGYWSRTLIKSDQPYDRTDRECLPVVCSIVLLRMYLEGSRLTIQMDHETLRCILNMMNMTGKLAPAIRQNG